MKLGTRHFWLGFSAAIGGLLTFAVIAYAAQTRSSPSRQAVLKEANGPTQGSGFNLAALDKPRTPADDFQGDAAEIASHLFDGVPSADVDPGSILTSKSRLLLSNLGARSGRFYVVPTIKGQLCYVITGYADSGCVSPSPLDLNGIDWGLSDNDGIGEGEPLIVHGLVANDVREVDVVVSGSREQATLANNAFYSEVEGAVWPSALLVTFADGRQTRIATPSPPSP
jgi:hypothetical protein